MLENAIIVIGAIIAIGQLAQAYRASGESERKHQTANEVQRAFREGFKAGTEATRESVELGMRYPTKGKN